MDALRGVPPTLLRNKGNTAHSSISGTAAIVLVSAYGEMSGNTEKRAVRIAVCEKLKPKADQAVPMMPASANDCFANTTPIKVRVQKKYTAENSVKVFIYKVTPGSDNTVSVTSA